MLWGLFKQKMAMGDMSADAWFMELTRPPQYMRNAVYLNRGVGRMLEVARRDRQAWRVNNRLSQKVMPNEHAKMK